MTKVLQKMITCGDGIAENANIAAAGVLPMCQDTGTAIIMGKGQNIFTGVNDEEALSQGVYNTT